MGTGPLVRGRNGVACALKIVVGFGSGWRVVVAVREGRGSAGDAGGGANARAVEPRAVMETTGVLAVGGLGACSAGRGGSGRGSGRGAALVPACLFASARV